MVNRWIWVWIVIISSLYPFNQITGFKIGLGLLVVSFEKPLNSKDIRSFELKGKDNYRYVFDFKNTKLSSRNLLQDIEYKEPIDSIRVSQYRRDIARLVIQTQAPYKMRYYKPNPFTLSITSGLSTS